MSSKPIDTCTECMETVRASDIITFDECNKHRFCKGCLGKATTQSSTRSSHEKCPLCELSHRRLAVTVRCDLWAEAHAKVHCKGCGSHASGQRMTCGHGYCTPCLRKLPRSSLSRNLDGSMKSACQDCAKKAAEKFREEARSAMLHAEDIASRERDERESRERIEDLRLAREFRAKPRKRPAPSAPAAPAAAAAAPSGSHAAASTASNLASHPPKVHG
ncbi:Structural polyprotein [Frankliniella fusca]|uniref:Structural polyprotein n=1 Tax=Frankliniella fusca TaxID=407009 RepID=A0AAE1H077_9NEOP|nr:Structural polyprotein [Frankliniella fusca]